MGLSVRSAFSIAYAIDKRNKRDEWETRMNDNISRWESTIDKLNDIIDSSTDNIHKNRVGIEKAEYFLSTLNSTKSREWYLRACEKRDVFEELNTKVVEYENKVEKTTARIKRLNDWIHNDEIKVRDLESKISDIKSKIGDVESKLRNS